jgi:glyoxylase-like metal-dependent hydrolase (beta-lactamase superfamily II)
VAACGGGRIRWILATHTHPDHSPGVAGLRERTPEAIVLGYESRDGLDVDAEIGEGFVVEATEFRLRAVHTPGHASNHLCFLLERERLLFSGDHIMEGSTVVISPPDGDMAAYLDSLERLRGLRLKAIAPGHGHLIDDPAAKIDEYVTHRLAREQAIAAALADAGSATIDELVARVYTDVAEHLHPIARFSVHAHLLKLAAEGRAAGADLEGVWRVA